MEILLIHVLVLRCIAARISPYSVRHCSHSEYFRWKETVFFRVGIRLHMLCESEFLRNVCRCGYFTAASLQFPFRKPFTNCMSVFFFCKCFRHWENLMVQNTAQPQPLAKAMYKQKLDQVTAVPPRASPLSLDTTVSNWTRRFSIYMDSRTRTWRLSPYVAGYSV